MPIPRLPTISFHETYEGIPTRRASLDENLLTAHTNRSEPIQPTSTDDNFTSTLAILPARLRTDLTVDLQKLLGKENLRTFPQDESGISFATPKLAAHGVIDPYINYLKDAKQLKNTSAVSIMKNLVSQLGKPALDQHQGSPQQYVSHGFDHSERVAGYIDKITEAYPEIEKSAAAKYNISTNLARLLFKILAHWHDIGYPDLRGRPKATHGLTGASKFDGIANQLRILIGRKNAEPAILDMRKAIQLHSADVNAEQYSFSVKTDRGALLTPDTKSLERLLSHYSTPSSSHHQVSTVEIRASGAKEMEKEVAQILERQKLPSVKIIAHEDEAGYPGRTTSLDEEKQVEVGLRYTKLELTENPFAIIRFADNLDMAADRLSPLQRSPVFQAMYRMLGDHGPIGQALRDLSKLDGKNTTDVPAILRHLEGAEAGGSSTDVDSSILSNAKTHFTSSPDTKLDASTARRQLIKSTVDSVLSTIAQGLSKPERTTLSEIGYRLNEESIWHFGGCEAIESVDVKPGKVIVTVNGPLFHKLNETKDPAGIGIGEYQIERLRQALSSLTIDGQLPIIEVVAGA